MKTPNSLPSKAYLDSVLRYEPETGHLFWTEPRPGRDLSSPVGVSNGVKRRIQLRLNNRQYLGHRIIWKMQTGKDPTEIIDHINHDFSDNRWVNLREATRSQNKQNSRGTKGKKLLKGVFKMGKKYYSSEIQVEKQRIYLGMFHTEQEAHDAYCLASEQLHGMFGCTESRPAA